MGENYYCAPADEAQLFYKDYQAVDEKPIVPDEDLKNQMIAQFSEGVDYIVEPNE